MGDKPVRAIILMMAAACLAVTIGCGNQNNYEDLAEAPQSYPRNNLYPLTAPPPGSVQPLQGYAPTRISALPYDNQPQYAGGYPADSYATQTVDGSYAYAGTTYGTTTTYPGTEYTGGYTAQPVAFSGDDPFAMTVPAATTASTSNYCPPGSTYCPVDTTGGQTYGTTYAAAPALGATTYGTTTTYATTPSYQTVAAPIEGAITTYTPAGYTPPTTTTYAATSSYPTTTTYATTPSYPTSTTTTYDTTTTYTATPSYPTASATTIYDATTTYATAPVTTYDATPSYAATPSYQTTPVSTYDATPAYGATPASYTPPPPRSSFSSRRSASLSANTSTYARQPAPAPSTSYARQPAPSYGYGREPRLGRGEGTADWVIPVSALNSSGYAPAPSPYGTPQYGAPAPAPSGQTFAPPLSMNDRGGTPAPAFESAVAGQTAVNARDYRLVPVFDIPPRTHEGDAGPSQWFEVIRPGNGPVRIGRMTSTCVCVGVRIAKRQFAAGERILVEARMLSKPPRNNLTYGIYVNIADPVVVTVDADVTLRY